MKNISSLNFFGRPHILNGNKLSEKVSYHSISVIHLNFKNVNVRMAIAKVYVKCTVQNINIPFQ